MKHTVIKPLAVALLLGVSTLTLSSAYAVSGSGGGGGLWGQLVLLGLRALEVQKVI